MRGAIDIGPAFLPWRTCAAETHYGATRERIEQALADLSCGLWRATGVAVPRPSAHGMALLWLGRALQTIGLVGVISLVPFAAALFVLAAMDAPDAAIVALTGACAAAIGSLLLPAGMALIHRAKRLLVRLPLDLAARSASSRNAHAGRLLQRLGLILGLGFALIVALAAAFLAFGDPAAPVELPLLPPLPALLVVAAAVLLFGIVLLAGAIALFRRGLATLQPTGHELMASDRRRPILLLRSFGDDDMSVVQARTSATASAPTWGQIAALARLEESIAEQLRPFGPLVAIGKPGETLPELGAARDYYSDADWQAAALALMRDARLIVVIAGVTPGLRWELDAIARGRHQGKLIVLMPEPQRGRRWETIAEELADVPGFDGLPRELPPGLLCMHASPHASAGLGCTLLSARQSWKSDYDAAIQFAIYGMLGAAAAAVPAIEPETERALLRSG
jgi:hypothetical protein